MGSYLHVAYYLRHTWVITLKAAAMPTWPTPTIVTLAVGFEAVGAISINTFFSVMLLGYMSTT